MAFAVSSGDVILVVVFIAIAVSGVAFALGAGHALRQIGKGALSLELESDMPRPLADSRAAAQIHEDEVRQLVEAKAYRQRSRGEQPVDVEAEVARLLAEQEPAVAGDAGLREEVRQLVVARNERRLRQGKEPLDVEAEVERQLREFENLGQ